MADEPTPDQDGSESRPGFRARLAEVFAPDNVELVPRPKLELLEASDTERRMLQRDLDNLAYTALNYVGGAPQELKAIERRKLAQRARIAWMKDPQAGASVDLMNDFVFGRGMPKPKAADPEVQKCLDEAWDDPDNQLVLTSYAAQLSAGTDLSLQSNLFFLVFDDGKDGKVKLGMLDHDTVERVVRDPENRRRILYYVVNEPAPVKENYATGTPDVQDISQEDRVRYFAHWQNVDAAKDDAENGLRDPIDEPPAAKLGDGKVYHIAINRTGEMAFGHPTMDRTLRWHSAYNAFMDARVDLMQASAAFVMKRKVKGTPNQIQKMATQALSRHSSLGASLDGDPTTQLGPRAGSILTESENVSHEDFNISTQAGAAMQDAQMLRSQVSAATRWPQAYYGDATSSSLATATSLELPVLKLVENRQEIIESLVRWFLDRVIERAVDCKIITAELTEDELLALAKANGTAPDPNATPQDAANAQGAQSTGSAPSQTTAGQDQSLQYRPESMDLGEAHEDATKDEEATKRDLSYEFSMPNPLRRTVGDLVMAIMNIARTFDPNNTNIELSRILLNVALGEGLEMEDPAKSVEVIFPPGYVDPAVAAAQAQGQQPPPPPGLPNEQQNPDGSMSFGDFAPQQGADGQNHSEDNPYGAPQQSSTPEQMTEARGRDVNAERDRADEMRDGFEEAVLGAVKKELGG